MGEARLILLPIIEEPFNRIAVDIVGPLVRSKSGNRYILVVNDHAILYPEAVPMKNVEAERVAMELVKIFSRVGIPKEILSDQGSNFISQLLKKVYNLLQIDSICTSPYHLYANG